MPNDPWPETSLFDDRSKVCLEWRTAEQAENRKEVSGILV